LTVATATTATILTVAITKALTTALENVQ